MQVTKQVLTACLMAHHTVRYYKLEEFYVPRDSIPIEIKFELESSNSNSKLYWNFQNIVHFYVEAYIIFARMCNYVLLLQ